MKTYSYFCDGGSLALGNYDYMCHYMNNYGDGIHKVYIKEKWEPFPNLNQDDFYETYHFEGSMQGKFNVYNYDCYSKEERVKQENILVTLTGRYGVYSVKNSGDMLLEYWDNDT